VYDLETLPQDKLAWKPAKSTPQYHAAKQLEDFVSWKSWQNAVLKKSQALANKPPNVALSTSRREEGVGVRPRSTAAARLRIMLPGPAGKVVPGLGREVQIVGSKEWESLQGRMVVV